MSAERRLPPNEVWDTVMKMVREDEARRLEGLSDEELEREIASMGRDPKAERAKGGALAQQILEAKDGKTPAAVTALPSARPRAMRFWLVVAAFLAIVTGALVERREIIAWIKGNPAGIESDRSPPPTQTPEERAERVRDEAEKACHLEQWGLCNDKLDEARRLDPAGDPQARAQSLRTAIREHTRLGDAGHDLADKPQGR